MLRTLLAIGCRSLSFFPFLRLASLYSRCFFTSTLSRNAGGCKSDRLWTSGAALINGPRVARGYEAKAAISVVTRKNTQRQSDAELNFVQVGMTRLDSQRKEGGFFIEEPKWVLAVPWSGVRVESTRLVAYPSTGYNLLYNSTHWLGRIVFRRHLLRRPMPPLLM